MVTHCPDRTHQKSYVVPFRSVVLTPEFVVALERQFTFVAPPMILQCWGREIPRASRGLVSSASGVGLAMRPRGSRAPARRNLSCIVFGFGHVEDRELDVRLRVRLIGNLEAGGHNNNMDSGGAHK